MKKLLAVLILATATSFAFAQLKNPVMWSYTAKKIADKTYEVHVTASIEPGWHVYTLDHSAEVGVATSLKFNANPLAAADGKVQAKGKVVKMKDPSTGDMVKFYEGSVDLVQVFKLKANVKTNITGNVEFMTCDDKQCLPPTTKQFSISLQ